MPKPDWIRDRAGATLGAAQALVSALTLQLAWAIDSLGFISLFIGQFVGALIVLNHLGRAHTETFADRPTTVGWCRDAADIQGVLAGLAYAGWSWTASSEQLGGASIPAGVIAAGLLFGASGGITALITADIARHWYVNESA